MKKLLAVLAIVASCYSLSAFEKLDPHFKVGEGNAFCYVIIDWYGQQKCWSYSWWATGAAPTVFDVLKQIDHEDHRFKLAYQQMTDSYVDVYFMGYDEDDAAAQWDTENGGCSSQNYLVGVEDKQYYTQWWVFYQAGKRKDYGTAPIYSSMDACNSVKVANEQVYYFTIGSPEYDSNWNESPITCDESLLQFAESPYGWRVVDCVTSCTKANYKVPNNTLHRPTVYMNGSWGGPVTPYNPAWLAGELLSLEGEDDYVIIEFDHKVVDDPKNPYGYDFIAFGNSLIQGTKKDYYEESSDPGNWEYTGNLADEKALVEVSADGETWYSYDNGPFCDSWAPTQGIIYDKANYNTNWYAANRWWSVTTDATWPVHPNLTADKARGETIETLSYKYDTSAGGAAFDISGFPLPTDEKGRKYIKFVRIKPYYDEEEDETTLPEVDAISDVRPCTPYEEWRLANYTDYRTQWNTNLTGKTKTAPNGLPNVVNQIIGLGASESPVIQHNSGSQLLQSGSGSEAQEDRYSFSLYGIQPSENYVDLLFRSKLPLSANCGLEVKHTSDLSSGTWSKEVPSYQEPITQDDGTILNTLRVSNIGQFFKLVVED